MGWQSVKEFFKPNGTKFVAYVILLVLAYLALGWIAINPTPASEFVVVWIAAAFAYPYACLFDRYKLLAIVILLSGIILFLIL